ncbi:hypothetical protein PCL_05875 [Purpureocillium lilacinum]|uniref:Uncharacterized protein n=1 Tax=Purpureocillium lilacinum TaxID=33203 RepID=A0A2U3EL24_PURLI|nr:hypothetical protein Purlil1_5913 [Purpureocillium lilacinum]PWI75217.1 hypothetical protein PCL_05875 [Purpureocillium lilacinum]
MLTTERPTPERRRAVAQLWRGWTCFSPPAYGVMFWGSATCLGIEACGHDTLASRPGDQNCIIGVGSNRCTNRVIAAPPPDGDGPSGTTARANADEGQHQSGGSVDGRVEAESPMRPAHEDGAAPACRTVTKSIKAALLTQKVVHAPTIEDDTRQTPVAHAFEVAPAVLRNDGLRLAKASGG